MSSTSRSLGGRLVLPVSALIALAAFVHACGGGGSSGGGGNPPAPSPGPGPTGFVSTFVSPANSSVDVPRAPIILLGFNDTVNPATVNATNVSLTLAAAPVATTLTYVPCNNRIQMVPNAALDPNAVYSINLGAGLRDDDGEALTAVSFSFTTNALTDTVRPTFQQAGFGAAPNTGTETNEVLVTWMDAQDNLSPAGAISYRVYVSTTTANCFDYANPAVVVGAGQLSALVPGLNSRTGYSFVVRAVDGGGNESLNTTPATTTTFTSLASDVFALIKSPGNRCVSCHDPGGQATLQGINMNYSTPQTVFNSWVNQTSQCVTAGANGFGIRVVAGDPDTSFLWNKISGLPSGVVCGAQMPLSPNPVLTAAELSVFFDWIEEGALDN